VIPALLLCLLFASIYAFLAHFLFGTSWADMGRYWLAAVVGFGLAALASLWLGWDWGRLGAAPLAAGTVGAWAALLAMRLKR